MYRNPLHAAKARYDEARARVNRAPAALEHELFEQLPPLVQAELRLLEGQSRPEAETIDGFLKAEKAAVDFENRLLAAADLLAQLKFERDVGIRPARRLGRGCLWLAGGLAAIAALWYGPAKMVSAGKDAAYDCFDEKRAAAEGDWLECRQRLWLWPPRVFPWTRAEARDAAEDIEKRASREQLEASVRGPLDAAARDDAARALIAGLKEGAGVSAAVEAGAFAVVAASDEAQAEAADQAFAASLLSPDLARTHTLAAGGKDMRAASYQQNDHDVRRAAWLCLFNRPTDAAPILRDLHERETDSQRDAARAIAVACGITRQDLGFEPRTGPPRLLATLDMASARWQAGRRAAIADIWIGSSTYNRADELTALALAVVSRKRTASELLPEIAPPAGSDTTIDWSAALLMPTEPRGLTSVWAVRRSHGRVVLADVLERAADTLVETADAYRPPTDPEEVMRDVAADAVADPPKYLHRAAWALRIDAAAEWVRRGDPQRALDLATKAELVAPPTLSWLTAAIRHAAGDPAGAVRVTNDFLGSPAVRDAALGDVALARIELALALASLDRWPEALDAARQAATFVAPSADQDAVSPETLEAARWLAVALSLKVDPSAVIEGVLPLPSPPPWAGVEDRAAEIAGPTMGLAGFRGLALAPAEERTSARARHTLLGRGLPAHPDVLPAMFYIAGQIAAGSEVETWLDQVTSPALMAGSSRGGVRVVMLARAEAARWRGDTAAATRWGEQAARLAEPVVDAKTALLSYHAGL